MEKKELIGRKVVGFMFDPQQYPKVAYRHDQISACVGWKGEIVSYHTNNDTFLVSFPSTKYMVHYPAVLIGENVIDEEEPNVDLKVGDWVRGFKFEENVYPLYSPEMDLYIGQIGEVIDVSNESNIVWVKFPNNYKWCYPLNEAINHRVGDSTQLTPSDLKAMLTDEYKKPTSTIDYGKIEHDPLDNLPIIGDGVLMEVSDDGKQWHEKIVLGRLKNNCFLVEEEINHTAWAFARPIPKTKITRKEFEAKFEIID